MSRNILFVLINSIDPKSGGVSRVCYTLSAYWRNQGLSTFCITNVKSNAKFEYNDVYTFPYRMSNVEGNQAFLLDLIKKLEIRCLIIEYPDVSYLMNIVACAKNLVPIIGHYHNSPKGLTAIVSKLQDKPISRNYLFQKCIYYIQRIRYWSVNVRMGNIVDKMVLLSMEYFKELEDISSIPKTKLVCIPNPFNLPQDSSNRKTVVRKKQLLFVGRLYNPQKNIKMLLDLWHLISQVKQDYKLIIVGEGKEKNRWIEYVSNEKIERCEFVGIKDPTQFYRESELFLMTSFFEGFPMVLVEAMQHGCVPVCFNSFAALRDIIDDGINGAIIPAFNKALFMKRVFEYLDNKDLQSTLRRNALIKSKQFETSIVSEKWFKVFNDLNVF